MSKCGNTSAMSLGNVSLAIVTLCASQDRHCKTSKKKPVVSEMLSRKTKCSHNRGNSPQCTASESVVLYAHPFPVYVAHTTVKLRQHRFKSRIFKKYWCKFLQSKETILIWNLAQLLGRLHKVHLLYWGFVAKAERQT
jgi:hypothetical protein